MFSTKKFSDMTSLVTHLNGGIQSGVNLTNGVRGLVGKTITFTRPAFSVTFAAVPGWIGYDTLQVGHIKTQIEAASNKVMVLFWNDGLAIVERTPTQGVALDPALTEEARALLGFPITGTCEGRIIKPLMSAAPPRLESIQQVKDGSYMVLFWEGN